MKESINTLTSLTEFKYTLEPYRGIKSRHICPSCGARHGFVRYIDTSTGDQLGDDIGRCNSEVHCGYHKKPNSNGISLNARPEYFEVKKPTPLNFNRRLFVVNVMKSNLYKFLHKYFILSDLFKVMERYKVDATKELWAGASVFYQTDRKGVVWAGKVMDYDKETGKRVKVPRPRLTWVHSFLKIDGFVLEQHLFGEHLITDNPEDKYILVESEKTALIGAMVEPEYIWLASGGLSNLSSKKLEVLSGKNVLAIPDKGGTDKWREKLEPLGISVLDIMEKEDIDEGDDIADVYLKEIKSGIRKTM